MAVCELTVLVLYVISLCLNLHILIIQAKNVPFGFDLNEFTADDVPKFFRFDGDAQIESENIIKLTDSRNGLKGNGSGSAGRFAYYRSIPLWSNSTKAVANFSTHFQFQLNWTNQSSAEQIDQGGNGFAFFMTNIISGFRLPYKGDGRWLGLTNRNTDGNKTNQLVAVEFDTYRSGWDPSDNHIGIDVNSIVSVTNISLKEKLNNGKIWDAWIDFNGQSNILRVSVSSGSEQRNLSLKINSTEYLPENVVIGFSAAARKSSELHRLISWNFTSVISEKGKRGRISAKIVVVIVCIASCKIILVLFAIALYRRRKRQTPDDMKEEVKSEMDADVDMVLEHVPRKFPFAELSAATNNFSEEQKLGEGGFGGVYKGILLTTNEIVAVKRISAGSKQGKKEYLAEIGTITRLRHRNLVQLLGWSHEKGQLLLVYEYMPNGSLDNLLFGEKRGALDWTRRYRIATDIASALLYLHELWEECVVHRDIKSSNVMLDSEFNAKVGDFGLARLVKHDRWSQTTTIAGTLGYLAPECAVTGISSTESDVFSFGAVALEIACGRRALDVRLEEGKVRLVEWVWNLYGEGRLFDAVDSSLRGEYDRAEMEQLMVMGLWCSHPDPFTRPKTRQVLQLLNFEVSLPRLPPTLPVPSYSPLQQGFFSHTSDRPPPRSGSLGIAVHSGSLYSDIPRS